MLEALPPRVYALGFSLRKRAMVRQFMGATEVKFVSRLAQVPDGATTAVWASGPFGNRTADGEPATQQPMARRISRDLKLDEEAPR